MSIVHHAGNPARPRVTSPESMYETIMELGLVPFFENPVPGYSIEEMTPPQFWFDGDGAALGPWDWKIFAVQSGDIAYGKFLWGGKAAFATLDWYGHLLNWRRSQPKYQPTAPQRQILAYLEQYGSIGIREVRGLLGVKKSEADTLITRLQLQCRVVTGDILRVYRGEDLHYNGWQRSSFCTPEALFEAPSGAAGNPFFSGSGLSIPTCPPEESLAALIAHVQKIAPEATGAQIRKMLG